MFHIGNLPTGDKDPFALRRHALGVVRMLVEAGLALDLQATVQVGFDVLEDESLQVAWSEKQAQLKAEEQARTGKGGLSAFGHAKRSVDPQTIVALVDFIYERLAGSLRDQGFSAQEVDAALAQRPPRLSDVPKRLAAVRTFAALPEAPALAAANKRIANILKKAGEVDPHVSEILLHEPAEKALYAAMNDVVPKADALFDAGDYTASLQALAALRAPVDAFFDGVMVNADQADLRLNRHGLLKALHNAMNRVADLSRLAT
jgi:glycyl-tRNA synthetase beta chain